VIKVAPIKIPSMFYAGFGARQAPQDILDKMTSIAAYLEALGYTLRSGGAIGSDSAFEKGVYGFKSIFLKNDATPEALELSSKYHPNWNCLKEYERSLHGRNAQILLGRKLNMPVDFGICWTPGGKEIGGTGQTIRIAKAYGIKIYNIAIESELEELRSFVRSLKRVYKSPPQILKVATDLNQLDSSRDGFDHINTYSKGKTTLGRFLTNFSRSPFTCEDGHFDSIEGYWYWLGSSKDEKAEPLRRMSGFEAKKFGREIGCLDWIEGDVFKNKIKAAMKHKILANPIMLLDFKKSKLPFVHYYDYGGKIVKVPQVDWIMEHLEFLRELLNSESSLVYEKGSLLDIQVGDCIGHSCNALGDWGAGIAKELKTHFPGVWGDQLDFCRRWPVLGDYRLFSENGIQVISLFTSKGYGRNKSPEKDILENTRKALTGLFNETDIDHIYLPKINSGYFGVKWELTEQVLLDVLQRNPGKKITIRFQ
jgi:O-acetyl-ADP-ribose deacetylase (regulator of RNase III)